MESPSRSPATTRRSPETGSSAACNHWMSGLSGIIAARPGISAGSWRRCATPARKSIRPRQHRDVGKPHGPDEHREIGVEPLAGQERSACRARHAQDALDLDRRARPSVRPACPAPRAARHAARRRRRLRSSSLSPRTRRRGRALRQPARRVNASPDAAGFPVGQALHQGQGILDRASAQGRMVERIDRGRRSGRRACPRARGADSRVSGSPRTSRRMFRARREHRLALAVRQRATFVPPIEPPSFSAPQRVDALDHLPVDLVDQRLGRRCSSARSLKAPVTTSMPASRHRPTSHAPAAPLAVPPILQPLPLQLRRHLHGSPAPPPAPAARPDRLAGLRHQQVARRLGMQHQRRAVGDVQHHHVHPRLRDDLVRLPPERTPATRTDCVKLPCSPRGGVRATGPAPRVAPVRRCPGTRKVMGAAHCSPCGSSAPARGFALIRRGRLVQPDRASSVRYGRHRRGSSIHSGSSPISMYSERASHRGRSTSASASSREIDGYVCGLPAGTNLAIRTSPRFLAGIVRDMHPLRGATRHFVDHLVEGQVQFDHLLEQLHGRHARALDVGCPALGVLAGCRAADPPVQRRAAIAGIDLDRPGPATPAADPAPCCKASADSRSPPPRARWESGVSSAVGERVISERLKWLDRRIT